MNDVLLDLWSRSAESVELQRNLIKSNDKPVDVVHAWVSQRLIVATTTNECTAIGNTYVSDLDAVADDSWRVWLLHYVFFVHIAQTSPRRASESGKGSGGLWSLNQRFR